MRSNPVRVAAITAFLSILSLVSCRKDDAVTGTDTGDSTTTTDDFVTNTRDTVYSNAVTINYTDTLVTVTNPFSSSGVTVAVTNRDVVVTSTNTATEINYVLSGKTTNGSFKLYGEYKFGLVLNGVSIINTDGPAINIQCGKKNTVTLLSGTNNRLIDGATYATSTEDQKGTFFSEGQILISGNGSLIVTGKNKHAICSDDYISISGGTISVTAAASDGIHANDYFKMDGGTVTVTSSGDGIEAEEGYVAISGGTINVTSVDDGIAASYEGTDASITPYVSVTGGVITVTTSGDKGNAFKSESYTTINNTNAMTLKVAGKGSKGFKTGTDFTLTNGNINITTIGSAFYDSGDADIVAPAGINCDRNAVITAGALTITSSGAGGKGISVDSALTVNGGTINITASGVDFTYGSSSSEAKGIKSDGALSINNGTLTIAATDDGIKSEKSIIISNGSVSITKSAEGLEAPAITLAGGKVSVVSSDDCVNGTYGNGGEANDGSLISFTGATVTLSSSGGDAIDGNGNAVMTGGTVVAQGPASQPELAIDINGTFNISGGLLIGSGPNSGNMIEGTSATSAQYAMLVKVNGNVSANTLFTVQDASGNNLVTYAPSRTAYYFVFSSPSLASGATYKIYTGGSSTGTSAGGLYGGGIYSGGILRGTATISGKLTTVSL